MIGSITLRGGHEEYVCLYLYNCNLSWHLSVDLHVARNDVITALAKSPLKRFL